MKKKSNLWKNLVFCATLLLMLSMCTLAPALHIKAFHLKDERNYGEWICVKNADGTLTVTGYRALEQLTRGILEIPSSIEGMAVTGVGGECPSSPPHCWGNDYTCDQACFHTFSPELVKELILPDTIECIYTDPGYSIFRQFANLRKLQLPHNDFVCYEGYGDSPDTTYFPYLEEVSLLNLYSLPQNPDDSYNALKKLTFYENVTEIENEDGIFPELQEINLPSTVQVFCWANSPKLSVLNYPKDLGNVCIYSLIDCPNLHVTANVDMKVRDSWGFHNSGVTEINLKNVPEESRPWDDDITILNAVAYNHVTECNDLTAINVISGTRNSILSSQSGVLFYKDYLVRYPAGKSAVSDYTLPENCRGFSATAFDDCKITSITIPEHIKDFTLLYWQFSDTSSFFNGKFKVRVINGQCGYYDNWHWYCKGKSVHAEYYWGNNYTISYELNGGINAPDNPTSYRAGDDYIELNDPTRTGYTFLGWKRNDVTGYEPTTKNKTGFKDYIFTAEWKQSPSSGSSDGEKNNIQSSSIDTIIPNILGGNYKVTGAGLEVEFTKPSNANAKSVTIPDTIQANGTTYKVTSIAPSAFKNNKYLTKVKIGRNVAKIGANAFSGCKKLKKVTLGSGLTSINAKAFYKCVNLTKITIPGSVEKIGKQAFSACPQLKSIVIKSTKLTTKNVGSKAFSKIYKKVTVKVPKKSLKAYKRLLRKKGLSFSAKIKK